MNSSLLLRAVPDEALPLIAEGLIRLALRRRGPANAWTVHDSRRKNYTICVLESVAREISGDALRGLVQHEINHAVLSHLSLLQLECPGVDALIACDAHANWYLEQDGRYDIIVKELARIQKIPQESAGTRPSTVLRSVGLDTRVPQDARVVHEKLHAGSPPRSRLMCGGIIDAEGQSAGTLTRTRGLSSRGAPRRAVEGFAPSTFVKGPAPPWVEDVLRLLPPHDSELELRRRRSRPILSLLEGAGVYVAAEKPSWEVTKPLVALLVDVSGSMWEGPVLSGVAGAVDEMLRHCRVRCVAGDVRVTVDSELVAGFPKEVVGGGDTDVVPLFERAVQYGPSAAVCLTDAEVPRWPEQPQFDVIWVVPAGAEERPPWGRIVVCV